MSGTGILNAAVGFAVAQAAGLAGGSMAFGSAGTVLLGDFEFFNTEIPDQITYGGQQHMAIHKLPGGSRVIDLLGRDDKNLEWSGIFLSADAADRARELDAMRVAGMPVPLSFGDQFVPAVIIGNFEADFRRTNWIPYRISCVVLDPGDIATGGGPSAYNAINDDLGAAAGMPIQLATPDVLGPLAASQQVAGQTVGIVPGSPAALALQNSLATTQGAIGAAQANAEGVLSGMSAAAPPGGIVPSVGDFPATLDAAQQVAGLSAADGYVGRAAMNATGLYG